MRLALVLVGLSACTPQQSAPPVPPPAPVVAVVPATASPATSPAPAPTPELPVGGAAASPPWPAFRSLALPVAPCTGACDESASAFFGPSPHRSDGPPQPTREERDAAWRRLEALCSARDAGACAITGAVVKQLGEDGIDRYRHRFILTAHGLAAECFVIRDSWLPLGPLVDLLDAFGSRFHRSCDGRAGAPKTFHMALDLQRPSVREQLTSVDLVDSADFEACVRNAWGSSKPIVVGICSLDVTL